MKKTLLGDLKSLTRSEMKHITGGVMAYELSLEMTNGGYRFGEVYPYIKANDDCIWVVDTIWQNGAVVETQEAVNYRGVSCNNVC